MTTTSPRRRACLAVATTITVLGLLAGCGDALSLSPPKDPVHQQQALAARPTLEQTITRYNTMQTEIRDQLDAEIGPFPWTQSRPPSRDTCGSDFPHSNGATADLGVWSFIGAIPDNDWPRAKQITTDITARYGFTTAGMQLDRPGYHELNGFDTTLGAHYNLGGQINTALNVATGCHLPTTPP